MDFLRRIFGSSPANSNEPDSAIHLYVRCNRCGSPVHVRVDPRNDLIADYGEDDNASGYTLHKEIMDSRCFRIMRAEINYDRARHETGRTLDGGTFITKEAYDQILAEPKPS